MSTHTQVNERARRCNSLNILSVAGRSTASNNSNSNSERVNGSRLNTLAVHILQQARPKDAKCVDFAHCRERDHQAGIACVLTIVMAKMQDVCQRVQLSRDKSQSRRDDKLSLRDAHTVFQQIVEWSELTGGAGIDFLGVDWVDTTTFPDETRFVDRDIVFATRGAQQAFLCPTVRTWCQSKGGVYSENTQLFREHVGVIVDWGADVLYDTFASMVRMVGQRQYGLANKLFDQLLFNLEGDRTL